MKKIIFSLFLFLSISHCAESIPDMSPQERIQDTRERARSTNLDWCTQCALTEEERINWAERTVQNITAGHPAEKPISYVALGAGGLLQDALIIEELTLLGYDVHVFVVDKATTRRHIAALFNVISYPERVTLEQLPHNRDDLAKILEQEPKVFDVIIAADVPDIKAIAGTLALLSRGQEKRPVLHLLKSKEHPRKERQKAVPSKPTPKKKKKKKPFRL